MNDLLEVAALVMIAYSIALAIIGPFYLGESVQRTATGYVLGLGIKALSILMAGRILGWW